MDYYNVKSAPYNAQGDGTTDDASAIQDAINDANNAKGGVVFFPPGKYLVNSSLELKGVVRLKGSGWSTNSTDDGSFIYFNSNLGSATLNVTGRSSEIRDLGFCCDQSLPAQGASSWSPNMYGDQYAIHIKADDVKLRNIMLYNVPRGITMGQTTGSIGRVVLKGIYGQPLHEGIKVDNALDVVKISEVHFWPFWSGNSLVGNYQKHNATGLSSYRNDNPFYHDIFCLGYAVGMLFGTSVNPGGSGVDPNIWGKTSKFKLTNIDMDFCPVGIKIIGNNTTGQIVNLSCQGTSPGEPNFEGISVSADGVRLQVVNSHISVYSSNGVRVGGNGTWVALDNCWIDNWNKSSQGFPAIEATDPNTTIWVGRSRWFENGSGAPDTGGPGTITLDQ